MKFAQDHMSWTTQWRKIIFSDEKKFNLDGPDGYRYYWHDTRKEPRLLSRRQMGGGSVMMWAAIGYERKSPIVLLDGRVNSAQYLNLLRVQANNFEDMAGPDYYFQQDNAPIHTARVVKNWLESEQIRLLEWPARSPDLNIIENVWGLLTRDVYADARQFDTKNELKRAIQASWERIDQQIIKNLFDAIPNRIFEVIRSNGNITKY